MIRYGVIGAGMMGVEHIRCINALDGAAIAAVADPHPPSLERGLAAIRDGGGAARSFADYRDLLTAGICDALVIATPNCTHEAILADALQESSLHILVEKPLCISVAECRRTMQRARGRDGLVWVGLEYRYMPPTARLLAEFAGGVIGKARMIAVREHRFPFLVKVGDWNRFNRNTGGTLVEKCCHFFDLMNLIAGARPRQVAAFGGRDVNHLDERYRGEAPDILDNAFVMIEYESGARAMLDLCMFAEATRNQEEISIAGDQGKLEALIPDDIVRRGVRGKHDIGAVCEIPIKDDSIAYRGAHHGASFVEHRRFLRAINNGAPAEVTLEDGLWSVAVGVAAQRAIAGRRIVAVDEVMNDPAA